MEYSIHRHGLNEYGPAGYTSKLYDVRYSKTLEIAKEFYPKVEHRTCNAWTNNEINLFMEHMQRRLITEGYRVF